MRFDQLLVKAVFITALLAAVPLGTAEAQVIVTSATPSSAPQGTVALDVEIAGSGFDSTAQVEFLVTGSTNPGGITVKKVVARGSKKLIATIDVADNATVADFDIAVTLSDGRKGKGTTLFKVQAKPGGKTPPPDPVFTIGLSPGSGIDTGVMDYAGTYTATLLAHAGGMNLAFWSEDGTEILVDSRDALDPDSDYTFTIFNVADPAQRRMVSLPGTIQEFGGIGSYAWSRHRADGCGNLLAKVRLDSLTTGQQSLWFVTTDGSELATSLPLDNAADETAYVSSWSGDGQTLLYSVVKTGTDADGRVGFIVDRLRMAAIPECVSSGSAIAFNPDSAPPTATIDVRTTAQSALASTASGYPYTFVDSSWHNANRDASLVIMRMHVRDAKGSPRNDLWLLDLRGSDPVLHRLTGPDRPDSSANAFQSTWAPDGKEIVYLASNRRGKRIVNRMNMETCLASIDSGAGYVGCTATTVITKDIARIDWRPTWVRPAQ